MKRIEKIFFELNHCSSERGVTAGELAEKLGLSRANVSNDLNCLCKEGKVCKSGTKPVYYRPSQSAKRQNSDDILDMFAKSNPSLFHCVEQAKAAVLYPPHGMHMMLFGETGVGKSMFAEMIYHYACESGHLADNAPFVVFNCADYSDNPQLLVSQLMGTKKGAYTGADADRPGLLEKADGGVLFLDEVHRLPPQGQEMLFTFIDKGVYRRLGETTERKATVLLLCATTENPKSTLLRTFVRRIPMLIQIPNLDGRSMDERLNFINTFFVDESARLEKPIYVSVNSVRSLLGYHCPNNIGQLKNDIRIICAEAYSNYISGKKNEIVIVSHDLPEYIQEGLYQETSHREIWKRYLGVNQRFCVFDSSAEKKPSQDTSGSIYDRIDLRMQELKREGADSAVIEKEIDSDIHAYFDKYTHMPEHFSNFSTLRSLVGMDVIAVTDNLLSYAEEHLISSFGNNVRYGLAVHIYSAISRVKNGRRIVNPQLNHIRKSLPNEFSVALYGLEIINNTFHIDMPIDEAGFLAVFFDLNHYKKSEKVLVVIIAHGNSTATSMAETVNRLLGIKFIWGIDASLDEKPQDVYKRLKSLVKEHSPNAGVLLLVDMGSLTNFAADLQKETGTPTRVIPLVSTLHAIEAARKASLGYPLDYIYNETKRVDEQLYSLTPSAPARNRMAKTFIITICSTGEGSAALIKSIFDSQLNYHNGFCETVALKLTDRQNIIARLQSIQNIGKIICTVSTFRINFPVPHFNLNDVLSGNAIASIQNLIDREAAFGKIYETFSTMLKSRDSANIFMKTRLFVEEIEKKSGRILKPDVTVGVLCHLGCMVDRLLQGQTSVSFPDKSSYIAENRPLFEIIKGSCSIFQKEFSVKIPEDEMCHIITFFSLENCNKTKNCDAQQ